MDLSNISKQNKIDRKGSKIFELNFTDELILVQHSGNVDFGIDYDAEIIDKEKSRTTGYFINIQLKSHEKINFSSEGNFSQSFSVKNARYWLASNLPVILVLVDLSTNIIYGVDIKEKIRETYDFEKMETQDYISVSVSQKDIFQMRTCYKAIYEYEKYNFLETAFSDYILFRTFFIYFASKMRQDPGIVDEYDDLTNEVLIFAKKYYNYFFWEKDIQNQYDKMINTIKKHLNVNGLIYYYDYDYSTFERDEFNSAAYDLFVNLIKNINHEIEKDKTINLKYKLSKFIKLKKEIDENDPPYSGFYWLNINDAFYNEPDEED